MITVIATKNLERLLNLFYKSSIEDKYENMKGIVAIYGARDLSQR